jgi:hypothetical protein
MASTRGVSDEQIIEVVTGRRMTAAEIREALFRRGIVVTQPRLVVYLSAMVDAGLLQKSDDGRYLCMRNHPLQEWMGLKPVIVGTPRVVRFDRETTT